jgi:hypothetical protein
MVVNWKQSIRNARSFGSANKAIDKTIGHRTRITGIYLQSLLPYKEKRMLYRGPTAILPRIVWRFKFDIYILCIILPNVEHTLPIFYNIPYSLEAEFWVFDLKAAKTP